MDHPVEVKKVVIRYSEITENECKYLQPVLLFWMSWNDSESENRLCLVTSYALPLILYCVDSAGGWPHSGFLFKEAVDEWPEDDNQNHTAAEDHHLFLENRRETDEDSVTSPSQTITQDKSKTEDNPIQIKIKLKRRSRPNPDGSRPGRSQHQAWVRI